MHIPKSSYNSARRSRAIFWPTCGSMPARSIRERSSRATTVSTRPSVLYSQCRMYGYNIDELSKVEDFVVVEDMGTQPRTEANGQTVEYGPTYKQLHAISHGKPIVAVTLVERRLSHGAEPDAAGDGRGGGTQRFVPVVADVAGGAARADDGGRSTAG